jgi:hypothetical protein
MTTYVGFPPEIFLWYGMFKNQQIPHEIKEKSSFVSFRVLIWFRTQVPSGGNPGVSDYM